MIDTLLTIATLGLIISGLVNRRWYASTAHDLTWVAVCLTAFVDELVPRPHIGTAIWCLAFACLWLHNARRSAHNEIRQDVDQ